MRFPSLVLILAAPLSVAQCGGPLGSPTAPSVAIAPSAMTGVATGSNTTRLHTDTLRVARVKEESPVGAWTGDLYLVELDNSEFHEAVALTFVEVNPRLYRAIVGGSTLELVPSGGGDYMATLFTDEPLRTCGSGLPERVRYTGDNARLGKMNAYIPMSGLSDDCTLEYILIDLKRVKK